MKNSTVRARINSELKGDVESILGDLGLTTSDAINALFCQIRLHNGLPFDVKTPNEITKKVLAGSAKGKQTQKFNSVDELFEDLDL